MPPVKNPRVMTSYGGIIRIRLRVEVGLLPLSLLTQAPLYLFHFLLYTCFSKTQDIFIFSSHNSGTRPSRKQESPQQPELLWRQILL